ncbi:hypothetical protein [Mycoplasmopsis canis]|uniref:hypothetical protein n=1 Tax=Mycoplasmopsis canis TaxID=29555 RepID=UPI00030BCE16|nr:hypothetical protein [Mycoplasmopsis canis]
MKKQIHFKKIPFKTKLRYVFLGKYPVERRYKPKILEYLFMIFSNILIMILSIILFYVVKDVKNISSETNFYENLFTKFNSYENRIFISVLLIAYIINFVLSIHVFYILKKTEFNKIFAIFGALSSLLLLSPIAIIFLIIAYQKNELAFE